jgi:hypothetical protein
MFKAGKLPVLRHWSFYLFFIVFVILIMLVHVFFLRKIFACNFFAFFNNLIYWMPQKPNVLIWVWVIFFISVATREKIPYSLWKIGKINFRKCSKEWCAYFWVFYISVAGYQNPQKFVSDWKDWFLTALRWFQCCFFCQCSIVVGFHGSICHAIGDLHFF